MANREELALFSPLLRYPHSGQIVAARVALERFADQPKVVALIQDLVDFLGAHKQHDLEEKYTQTFEINPAVALEVGFHLFGLAYQRGEFLARAKQAAEELGVDTGFELADHLPVMLELAAVLDEETAVSLIQEAIFPAVRHMANGFRGQAPGFGRVVLALHEYLEAHYECITYTPDEPAPKGEVSSHV